MQITDLIPTRHYTLITAFLLGLTAVTTLTALHGYGEGWANTLGAEHLAALSLGGNGTLACWMSSFLLVLAMTLCLLIYVIRRHKLDDYRARYRIWLWAACCMLVASIDATAGLHTILQGVLVHLSGTPLYGDGTVWWILPFSVAYGMLGILLLVDMRHCLTAAAGCVAAIMLYAAAILLRLGLVLEPGGALSTLLLADSILIGHVLLLLTLGFYSRHVLLTAQGKIKVSIRARTNRQEEPSRSTLALDDGRPAGSEAVKTKAKAGNRSAKYASASKLSHSRSDLAPQLSVVGTTAVTTQGEGGTSAEESWQNLSKSERRRLRKQMRRQKKAG